MLHTATAVGRWQHPGTPEPPPQGSGANGVAINGYDVVIGSDYLVDNVQLGAAPEPATLGVVTNGDFEYTIGWGSAGDANPPVGWPIQTGATTQPFTRQSGANAIGGSGTSALVPDGSAGVALSEQATTTTPSVWRFEMDFAAEDPGAGLDINNRTAVVLLRTSPTVGEGDIHMAVVDANDDGVGDIAFSHGSTFAVVLPDAVILDSDVSTAPLVHHLMIRGDFSSATASERNYDVFVLDSSR